MKKAYLKELQTQLLGTVTDSPDVCDYFSTDGSIFQITPEAVVYPQNTADVRKTVQFLDERLQSGKPVGIIARGKGTDQSGGAVGAGVQVVFTAHMNRILRMDKDSVTVQPGLLYRTLQQTLHTHGRFLPPFPASIDFSSLGGAVANNAAGEKSLKYGVTRDFVRSLKVVLADGSLIETRRISARELNRKKGQSDLEGEIYRRLDALVLDHEDVISRAKLKTTKNSAGYALDSVRGKDGSFDLTPLFVGSQGTLGLITEITFKTVLWNPRTTLQAGFFDSLEKASEAVGKLSALKPSAMEMVDFYLLDYLRQHRPQDIAGLVPDELPKIALLVEFDDISQLKQAGSSRRAQRILAKYSQSWRVSTDPVEQEALWKIRRNAAAVLSLQHGSKRPLPFIEDAAVPPAKLPAFLGKVYKLLEKYDLEIAVWGHAGDANLHLQPLLDLSRKKDVTKLYELADEFYRVVAEMGGTISGEHNDGLIRGPYLEHQFGKEMFTLLEETKQIFDPHHLLNPGKKTEAKADVGRQHLRQQYSMGHLYDHLPHS